jgi:hypothetical protein
MLPLINVLFRTIVTSIGISLLTKGVPKVYKELGSILVEAGIVDNLPDPDLKELITTALASGPLKQIESQGEGKDALEKARQALFGTGYDLTRN